MLDELSSAVAGLMHTACEQLVLPRFRRLSSKDIETKSGPNEWHMSRPIASADELFRRLAHEPLANAPQIKIMFDIHHLTIQVHVPHGTSRARMQMHGQRGRRDSHVSTLASLDRLLNQL